MPKRDDGFPWWLVVLGFPLAGAIFAGVAFGWSWAMGGGRPPAPLAVPVELFVERVAMPLLDRPLLSGVGDVVKIAFCAVLWEVAWLTAGVVVTGVLSLLVLLVPRSKGDDG